MAKYIIYSYDSRSGIGRDDQREDGAADDRIVAELVAQAR